jgi:hypothetical protein
MFLNSPLCFYAKKSRASCMNLLLRIPYTKLYGIPRNYSELHGIIRNSVEFQKVTSVNSLLGTLRKTLDLADLSFGQEYGLKKLLSHLFASKFPLKFDVTVNLQFQLDSDTALNL